MISMSTSGRESIFSSYKVSPNTSLEIFNWMIHMQYTRKQFSQCKKLAEGELIRSNGYSEYGNYILGKIYQEEGEIQNSLTFFKKCNVLNPKNVEYLKQIGRCLFLLGRYKLALEIFFKAKNMSEMSDWSISHYLGICFVKLKNENEAKEYYKRAVQIGRNEKSFFELAKLLENQQDYANAIDVYQTALRLYPSNTELSVSLGMIYMKLEDYKKAFNQLGCALAHDSTNPDALFTFAAEIQRHGEYDVAILKYKIAAQKLSECSELWNNIGMCFFGKRKYVAAITCLKRAYYLIPTNWLTSYNLGLLHLNTKQYASAAIFLSTAAKFNPQHGPTFTLLALSLKKLGDVPNCKLCFEEALKRNENDIEADINYASYLFSLDERAEAVKYYTHFKTLLNTAPNIDKELIHMGNILGEMIQKSEHQIKNITDDANECKITISNNKDKAEYSVENDQNDDKKTSENIASNSIAENRIESDEFDIEDELV